MLTDNNGLRMIRSISDLHSLTFHIWLMENSNLLNHQPSKNISSKNLTIKNYSERTFKTQSELSLFWDFSTISGVKSLRTSGKKINKHLNKPLKRSHQNLTILPNSLEIKTLFSITWQLLTLLLLKDHITSNLCIQNNSRHGSFWAEFVKISTTYHPPKHIMPEKTLSRAHSCHHMPLLTQLFERLIIKTFINDRCIFIILFYFSHFC